MEGPFKVRQSKSRRFLALGAKTNEQTILLTMDTAGAIFVAEDGTAEFTRVFAMDGFAWCVEKDKLLMRRPAGSTPEFLFQFQNGHVISRTGALALSVAKVPVMKPIRSSPKQAFELLVPDPAKGRDRTSGARRADRLAGTFRVRHAATGRFLAAMSRKWESLNFGLEFAPVGQAGDFFKAESDSEWTRVIGKDDLVWFVLKSGVPSEFGLNSWTDRTSLYCQFQLRDGYICDHQRNDRVMTIEQDGRAWFKDKKQDLFEAQQFEIIIGEGEVQGQERADPTIPVSKAIVFDSFLIDKFE